MTKQAVAGNKGTEDQTVCETLNIFGHLDIEVPLGANAICSTHVIA